MGLALVMVSCKDDESADTDTKLSSKAITSFSFLKSDNTALEEDLVGSIDEENRTIHVNVPTGTDVTALTPAIEASAHATVSPDGPQDFSTAVTYTVTAEDKSQVAYEVTMREAKAITIAVYLDFNFIVSGELIMTLCDNEEDRVVGTSVVDIEGFDDDQDGWTDFVFPAGTVLQEGKTYTIEMHRTIPNAPYQDVVLWWGSDDGDFTFRVYLAGEIYQKQEIHAQPNILDTDAYYTLTQEFVVGAQ